MPILYDDQVRRFTIRLDPEIAMLQVVAADAATREWALTVGAAAAMEEAMQPFRARPTAVTIEPARAAIADAMRKLYPAETVVLDVVA
jgi:hypothetical protein